MNRKSILPVLAGVVALAGLAAGLGLQEETRLKLREEQQVLQQQLDRATDLLAEHQRRASLPATAGAARFPAADFPAELMRLRAELALLRQLTNDMETARNENTEARAALDRYLAGEAVPKAATADFWPRDSWSFAGLGTPDNALRSSLWASNNGDLKALLDSTTGDMRQMMDKEFEGKSADEATLRAMDEVSNLKSVEVLKRDFPSEDTAELTAAFEEQDQTRTNRFLLKKVGNEWKLAGMGQ